MSSRFARDTDTGEMQPGQTPVTLDPPATRTAAARLTVPFYIWQLHVYDGTQPIPGLVCEVLLHRGKTKALISHNCDIDSGQKICNGTLRTTTKCSSSSFSGG